MPIYPPLVLPPAIVAPINQVWQRDGIVVRYSQAETEFVKVDDRIVQVLTFSGDVSATMGPTTLTANQLVIRDHDHTAEAVGGVVLNDPDVQIKAEHLVLNWQTKTGSAEQVHLQADTAALSARSMSISPTKITFEGGEFWLARESRPAVYLSAEGGTIIRGDRANLRGVTLHGYGLPIGPLPSYTVWLNDKSTGLQPPKITFGGGKIGIAGQSEYTFFDRLGVGIAYSAVPGQAFRSNLQATYLISGDDSVRLSPPDTLGERFRDSFFNNISMTQPRSELGSPVQLVSISSQGNRVIHGRLGEGTEVSRPWGVDYYGRFRGPAGWTFAALASSERLEVINGGPNRNRTFAQLTALAPVKKFGPFQTDIRFDQFLSGDYQWSRAQLGVYGTPARGFTAGLAFVSSHQQGTPDFAFDPLIGRSGILARVDYDWGPYSARYLAAYDASRGGWFDHEYELALVANVFEPFVTYRHQTGTMRFGVRLRLDGLRDRMRRRLDGE